MENNLPYIYWDEESEMYLINNFIGWKNDPQYNNSGFYHEEGDSLWRAGIAYITYGEERVKKGLLRAFRRKNNGKYQACRCNPLIGEGDVSRDQIIIAMAALKYRKDYKELKEIARNLPYRLSKRYIMTPNLWLWLRGISGSKILDYINQFYMLIELTIVINLNKIIKRQLKLKEYTQDELEHILSTIGETQIRSEILNTKWKKILDKISFPPYALHLSAWMIYVSRNTWIKKILQKLIISDMDSNNLLLKLMMGEEVDISEINNYKPMEEWRWSQDMTGLTRSRIIPNENLPEISLDKDILYELKKL